MSNFFSFVLTICVLTPWGKGHCPSVQQGQRSMIDCLNQPSKLHRIFECVNCGKHSLHTQHITVLLCFFSLETCWKVHFFLENYNKPFSSCQNFKNVLYLMDFKKLHPNNSTLCVTVWNSNTRDNEAQQFIAGIANKNNSRSLSSSLCPCITMSHSNYCCVFQKCLRRPLLEMGPWTLLFKYLRVTW